MSAPHQDVDPGLRRAGKVLALPTPSTPEGYHRQVRAMNALTRRRHRPGEEKSRVRGDIEVAQRWATRRDGPSLRLLVVRPAVPRQGVPEVLRIHGGGYAIGTPEQSTATAKRLATATNCVVVLPAYRLSTEALHPAALDDQLVVGGESAGGGLTAAVTLLARDRGEVGVAVQVPLHPLDDRPTEINEQLALIED